ncbi:MAG TPA: S28 family serine protease [Bacteroidales bacterium]|nr:S28 family serine protease [Bacteroidales bacterium]
MRKRIIITCFSILCLIITSQFYGYSPFYIAQAQNASTPLYQSLKALPGVVEVDPLKFKPPFTEKYLVKLRQWLDPRDTNAGYFIQRVFVSHFSSEAPTVLVTEGYAGSYAERADYTEELAALFNTNQILVEHRYFGSSMPEPLNWEYLTATGAAADHHHVVTLFKSIYPNKWINTGISKGGETALIHRTLYPDDVDLSVCYVGPLCFAVEDGRHEPFISSKVGSETDRKKVEDFQIEVLKRRNKIFPLFKKYCDQKKYTFKLPLQEIYDYCVLEFSFSFWQWGWEPSSIPSSGASNSDLCNYLVRVISPDYFANEGINTHPAFYVQAARELGYYGYDIQPFSRYLKIKSAEGYLEKIFLPEGCKADFDSTISLQCASFLEKNDSRMIFIYGEYDPWTAAAVNFTGKTNMQKFVCPKGDHGTRIRSFDDNTQQGIIESIRTWLE